MLLHLSAGAYGLASRPKDGLRQINEAIEISSTASARTLASEFFILAGELLLAISKDNATEAESLYQQALKNAQGVHAPLLELRAAMRLSRLWQEQGKREQAKTVLREAYAKITEGFNTTDLKEASTLLENLS
jgi:predicted ATPase